MGKNTNIAVITTNLTNGFGAQLLWGMQTEALETENDILLYTTKSAYNKGGIEFLHNKITAEKKADVAIIMAYQVNDAIADMYEKAGIKLVLLDTIYKDLSSVTSNNEKGAYDAGMYMAKSGRKRMGVVVGDDRNVASQKERLYGFIRALDESGISFDTNLIYRIEEYTYSAGKEALKYMVMNDVDGVFCAAGDYVAQGFLSEASRHGVNIPMSMGVVGFDDIEVAKDLEMTTVKQPLDLMGREAFKIAKAMIDNPDIGPIKKVFDCTFIQRNSA